MSGRPDDAAQQAARTLEEMKRMREIEAEIIARAPENDIGPSLERIQAVMDLAGDPSGTLTFLDVAGRMIHSETVKAGTPQMEFDLEQMGLTSGVYLVRLEHASGRRVERLVVR